MAPIASKLSGMLRFKPRANAAPAPASRPSKRFLPSNRSWSPSPNRSNLLRLLQLALLLPLLLATTACFEATRTTVTAGGGNPQAEREARCAAWRRIGYSGQHDTLVTIRAVRVHNAVGRKLQCWG